ncbi:MAG TPA: glycoside hydrolase family 88 protein, partial [Candidatus Egerieenecus merdigallinarum]|nr:glycoside hydrolase family 88 protein [Candidatus Egerieenecus merdigallinarum]
ISQRVLGKLQHNRGTGDIHDHLTLDTWEWPQGVAVYAMYKLYKATGNKQTLEDMRAWYARHLAKGLPSKNVNTMAPMLGMTLLYKETGDETYRPIIEEWSQWVMTQMPRTQEGGLQHITSDDVNEQQLWDDTLYMTCLFLYQAGDALGREDMKQEAEYQFLLHIKYLHSPKTGLWYHGYCFQGRHHFGQAYWGRGNSWFTACAVDFAEWIPDGPVRRLILNTWQEQCKALLSVQDPESGLWHTLLDQPDSYLETSASAAIAYGLLKGSRLGLLDEDCRAAGEKALQGVIAQVAEDGTVQGVSYGTPMGWTQDFYRTIPIQPTAYGQGLTFLMLTEKFAK